jgi:hypothetical protein
MRVHQCPKCELRFPDENEVKQHLIDDHHVEPEELDRIGSGHRPGVHTHRDTPQPRPGNSSP